jgi:hypothetical protein
MPSDQESQEKRFGEITNATWLDGTRGSYDIRSKEHFNRTRSIVGTPGARSSLFSSSVPDHAPGMIRRSVCIWQLRGHTWLRKAVAQLSASQGYRTANARSHALRYPIAILRAAQQSQRFYRALVTVRYYLCCNHGDLRTRRRRWRELLAARTLRQLRSGARGAWIGDPVIYYHSSASVGGSKNFINRRRHGKED